jgi:vacuolar-type H+-ATPase subunit H
VSGEHRRAESQAAVERADMQVKAANRKHARSIARAEAAVRREEEKKLRATRREIETERRELVREEKAMISRCRKGIRESEKAIAAVERHASKETAAIDRRLDILRGRNG